MDSESCSACKSWLRGYMVVLKHSCGKVIDLGYWRRKKVQQHLARQIKDEADSRSKQ